MKILIVMFGYFPGKQYGGPPVSVDNFCSLMNDMDCYVVTRDHDLNDTQRYQCIKSGWNERDNCKVLYLSDRDFSTASFEKIILETQPDVLYLQSMFQSCTLTCLQLARKHDITVLLAPRGELCKGALDIKKYKKMPYLKVLKILRLTENIDWQSTSDEETNAIRTLMGAKEERIHYLDNIPSIPVRDFKRRLKTPGKGRMVFLSRIHPKKNLLMAIRSLRKVRGTVEFDIYGPMEDAEYWSRCESEIDMLPSNVAVRYMDTVSHDLVHKTFSRYDAFLFPTLSENFGHVIVESMMVGTPVIVSDKTPWRNLQKVGAGWDLSLSDEEGFAAAVQNIVAMDKKEFECLSNSTKNYIREKLDIDSLKTTYEKAVRHIVHWGNSQ